MRLKSTLSLLLLIASTIGVTAHSYQGTATIKGTVVDWQDAVIPRVRITFRAGDRQTLAHTNETGVFEIELPAGRYELVIETIGFTKLVVKNLEVMIGMTDELTFQLEALPSKPFVVDEHITVVSSPLANTIKLRKIQ